MKRKLLAAILAGTLILQSGLAAAAEELLVEDACMPAEYCDDISEDEEIDVEIADVETDESVEAAELQTVEAGESAEEAVEPQVAAADESVEEAAEPQTFGADVEVLEDTEAEWSADTEMGEAVILSADEIVIEEITVEDRKEAETLLDVPSGFGEMESYSIGKTKTAIPVELTEEVQTKYYELTPSVSGTYEFNLTANDYMEFVIYNSVPERIVYGDSDEVIRCNLEAESTYYMKIAAGYEDTAMTGTMEIAYTALKVEYEEEYKVTAGEPLTISVTATSDCEITYQWQTWDGLNGIGTDIDGATSSSYQIASVPAGTHSWRCVISDQNGTQENAEILVRGVETLVTGELTLEFTEENADRYYYFTPEESGNYVFYTTGDLDTEAVLYDSTGKRLKSSATNGDDNFLINYELEAGKTYSLYVGLEGGDTGTAVFVTKYIGNTELQSGVNQVYVFGGGKCKFEFVPEQTGNYYFETSGSRLTVKDELDNSAFDSLYPEELAELEAGETYYVTVSDDNYIPHEGTISIYCATWGISYKEYLSATVGYPYTFSFDVETYGTNPTLTYTWYDGDGNVLGETSEPEFQVESITGSMDSYIPFTCVVSDGIIKQTASFKVALTTDLTLKVPSSVTVRPGEDAVITASASNAVDGTDFTFEWSYWDSSTSATVTLSETGPSATIPNVTKSMNVLCRVSDGYKTKGSYISVVVDSGLSVEEGQSNYITVIPGEAYTLTVHASTDYPELSFKWYKDYVGSSNVLSTNASLELSSVSNGDQYCCVVSDAYNSKYVYFNLTAVSTIQAEITGNRVPAGSEKAVVSVNASSSASDELTYIWQEYNTNSESASWKDISGETGTSIEILKSKFSGMSYRCVISDGTNTESIVFQISEYLIESAEDLEKAVAAESEETVVLEAKTSVDETLAGQLTYTWYCEGNEIEGAAGRTLYVTGIDKATEYSCYIVYKSGSRNVSATITFAVYPAGTEAADQEQAKEIALGETITVYGGSSTADAFVKFIPETTDTYTFTIGDVLARNVVLYDEAGQKLTEVTGNLYTLTKLKYDMQAGQTYYLTVSGGICEVTVTSSAQANCTHSWGLYVTEKEANCTAGIKTHTCIKCGLKESKTISATSQHTWDEGTVLAGGDCTQSGAIKYTCTVCGEIKTEYQTAAGHDYSDTWTIDKAATCKEAGEKSHHCKNCSARTDITVIAKADHTPGTWTVTKAATCKDAGTQVQKCTVCGETIDTKTIAVSDTHTPGTWTVTKTAACTEEGTQEQKCTVCGKTVGTKTIAATGHKYGDWIVTKEPTAVEEGVKTKRCEACGDKQTEAIEKLEATITLKAKKIPLQLKKSFDLKKVVTGLAEGDSITGWKSSKKSVATVSKSGIVKGKKVGKANITVTLASGKTAKIQVTVQKKAVTTKKIAGLKSKIKMVKGEQLTLVPSITPITTTDKLTYTSSNKRIVTVTKAGKVTAKKAGKAKITVKSGKKKFVINVTVSKK